MLRSSVSAAGGGGGEVGKDGGAGLCIDAAGDAEADWDRGGEGGNVGGDKGREGAALRSSESAEGSGGGQGLWTSSIGDDVGGDGGGNEGDGGKRSVLESKQHNFAEFAEQESSQQGFKAPCHKFLARIRLSVIPKFLV